MEKFGLLSFLLLVLHAFADEPKPGLVKDYVYVEKNLSWYDARVYCSNHHAEFFRVSDENDLKNLSGSAKQLSWIGLYMGHPAWYWVDKTRAIYFNWYKPGDCATIHRNGFWYDRSCNEAFNFVCNLNTGLWKFDNHDKTWLDAKTHCDSHHNGFGDYRNAVNNTNISALIPDGFAWIGLTKGLYNWTWVNSDPLTYSNWYTTLFCAVMDWRGFWYDRVCFEKLPFLCLRKINSRLEFMLVNENKTWSESQTHCKLLNMTLVIVKTQEEITALVVYIRGIYRSVVDDLYFWIGLFNEPWCWANSNSNIRNWHSMQPDNINFMNKPINDVQSCAASVDGEWFDEPCTEPLPFFCLATVRSMILVSEPKSWEEALEYCRGTYVDLASLVSFAEQQVAQRKIEHDQNDYVWIGLRFLEGSWFWVYGDSLEYENWTGEGQQQCPFPNHCGALSVTNGTWEARPCEEKTGLSLFPAVTCLEISGEF